MVGPSGNQTPNPGNANAMVYQVSYSQDHRKNKTQRKKRKEKKKKISNVVVVFLTL